jgi:hypothetical protein
MAGGVEMGAQPEGAENGGGAALGPWWPRAVMALAALAIGGVLAGAYLRGGSLDEYATVYFADPHVPLGIAWAHLWPGETNPPFFYLVARFWELVSGPGLFARRLVNLWPLGFVLVWFVCAARRYPAQRGFLLGLALFACSGKFLLLDFTQYRDYFSQYCAELVFLGAATLAYLERSRRVDWFQLAALPVLVMYHQVTALYTAVLLAMLLVAEWRRGAYLRAVSLTCVAGAAAVPLLWFTWLQQHQVHSVLREVSWITARGPLNAVYTILSHLMPAIGENYAAVLVAGVALLRPAVRPRALPGPWLRLVAGATLAATGVILVINHFAPLIVDRYFSFLAVEVMVMMALVLAPVFAARPRLAALVGANAAVYVVYSVLTVPLDQGWRPDAALVARLAAQCQGTRIYAGMRPVVAPERIGLAEVAARYHLVLLPPGPDAPGGSPPGGCPVIYWSEYGVPDKGLIAREGGDVARAANEAAGFGLDAGALAHARGILGKTGVIVVVSR